MAAGDTAAGRLACSERRRMMLGAAVPLGVLPARTAEFVAAIGAPMVITPWRSVLVCDLDEGVADAALRVLAPMGLVFDENSPWLAVSACTGSPGCEHSRADVRADARRRLRYFRRRGHRHYVGCERACGSPPGGEVLVATGDGYQPRLRRVSACSTTSATPPRSTGSRSRRFAPRPICRGFPTRLPAWWCG